MIIGIPKEIKVHEYRVGATPSLVEKLANFGHRVLVQKNAGRKIGFTDENFMNAGAEIVSEPKEIYESDMVLKVKEPQPSEYPFLRKGQILFCFLHLASDPIQTEALLKKEVIGIAYETVIDERGTLPLLEPMSEIAGKIAIQVGATSLQINNGGKGILLGGVPGVLPAKVLIIGGGSSGTEAARVALGMGADVTILDTNLQRLRSLNFYFGDKLKTAYSTKLMIEKLLPEIDLVVGAVLIPGKKAPKLITDQMLDLMSPGSVLVDISIDQGGCFETSKPTTHDMPTFIHKGIVHYCVTNMPGACSKTSTEALINASSNYVVKLANLGVKKALNEDSNLRMGLNVCLGKVTCKPVAIDLGYEYTDPQKALDLL